MNRITLYLDLCPNGYFKFTSNSAFIASDAEWNFFKMYFTGFKKKEAEKVKLSELVFDITSIKKFVLDGFNIVIVGVDENG